jgi:hypothetical protein
MGRIDLFQICVRWVRWFGPGGESRHTREAVRQRAPEAAFGMSAWARARSRLETSPPTPGPGSPDMRDGSGSGLEENREKGSDVREKENPLISETPDQLPVRSPLECRV